MFVFLWRFIFLITFSKKNICFFFIYLSFFLIITIILKNYTIKNFLFYLNKIKVQLKLSNQLKN